MLDIDVNQPVLTVKHLHRELGKKSFVAVDDVSFSVNAGQIVCLLGPNGAGKTTTVKMCATLLTPTSGSVTVVGVDAVASPAAAKQKLGLVLGGERGFYNRATARDNLLFFADVAKVPSKDRHARVSEALEMVSLSDRAGNKVQEFSRGMKQRLHIARSILNKPQLLLLDEPTNGLDPEIALEMRKLVRNLADQGTGILLTTHYLAEAEALSDRLLVLQEGRIHVDGGLTDVADAANIRSVSTFSTSQSPSGTKRILDQLRLDDDSWTGGIDVETLHSRTYVRLTWDLGENNHGQRLSRIESALGEPFQDLLTRRPTLEESYLGILAQSPHTSMRETAQH